MTGRALRIGVCGLGRGFLLTAPALLADPRVRLVAAAEPRPEARTRFETEYGRAYADIEELCGDPEVEVVYVASPHALHARHAMAAAAAGKHVLVEKPMALSLADCEAMIVVARAAGVRLLVGPSHGFDAPVQLARTLIASGDYGAPRMISALNYTDFLYRPRHPEELDTRRGGGAVFNQAPHQVDIVRRLMGAAVRSVRASTGVWDKARATEGAYSAFLAFEGGASASLTYSGYGHFDSDAFCDWIGETGGRKDPRLYGGSHRSLSPSACSESDQRRARAYGQSGAAAPDPAPRLHEHFGLVIVSCERADLRTTPEGVMVYGDFERRLHRLDPPRIPRGEVIDELWAAVVEGRAPVHTGEWGMATLEVCLAMLESSRRAVEVRLGRQGAGDVRHGAVEQGSETWRG